MDTAGPKPHRSRTFLALGAVLVATAAVYARGVSGELVYDDRLLIARNPLIADLGNLPRLLTSGYWDFLEESSEDIGYWRPLTAIVQALVYRVAGSSPPLYHVASLVVHLGAAAAAFFLARRLSGSPWIGAASALLFALHPAHVESVAWISALNDPLFGCFALLALERHVAWRQRGSRGYPGGAALAFALALLSKELGAAVLPLVLAIDLGRRREPGEAAGRWSGFHHGARAYGPFALVFALYLLARMAVFADPFAGFLRTVTDFGVSTARLALLRLEVLGGALELLLLPIDLNLFRPFRPHVELLDPALVRAAVFTALFLALLLACFLRERRPALAALLVIPCGLLPSLVRVESLGLFPLSDRFLYLPVFGFALALAGLLQGVFSRRLATALLVLIGAFYAARSAARIGVFRDEETLFRRTVAQSPRSVYALWGMGRVLLERFDATRDPAALDQALGVFQHAQELLLEAKQERTDLMVTSRDYLQVNLGLALCYLGQSGSPATAIAILEELERRITEVQEQERAARALGIRVREQHLDLERVQTVLGVALHKAHRDPEAEAALRKALELQPSFAEAHLALGRLYADQERWEPALKELGRATELWPGNAEARLTLARTLKTAGEDGRAEELALELLDELPQRAEPLIVLATVALARGDSTQALSWLGRALRLEPRNGFAWYQKARAFLLRKDERAAVAAFRNAVDLSPTNFEAHYDFGAFLLNSGLRAQSLPLLARAYALAPPLHRAALRSTLEQMEFTEAETPLELALADRGRGELDAAGTWVERALAIDPRHGAAWVLKARILRSQERTEEALAALRAACEIRDDYETWSELGEYLHELEREGEARSALERALAHEPPSSWPQELREKSPERLRGILRSIEGGGREPPAGGGD